jgi:hypothetical protein
MRTCGLTDSYWYWILNGGSRHPEWFAFLSLLRRVVVDSTEAIFLFPSLGQGVLISVCASGIDMFI